MQYTLRKIPEALDRLLRERAHRERKSLNEVAIGALARAMGLDDQPLRYRSLDELRGTWQEDADFDEAITDQHRIDNDLWGGR